MRVDMVVARTLRVESTQIWGIYGLYIRHRNNGVGNIFRMWVLGHIWQGSPPGSPAVCFGRQILRL